MPCATIELAGDLLAANKAKTLFRNLALIGLGVHNVCIAQEQPAPTAKPPPYTELRYDEDYSYLRYATNRTDFFDPIKYIPLREPGDWYLTFGGQVRDRYEYFNNYLFGSGPQDVNGYNLLRVMANADLHLGPHLRIFTEGISATEQGRTGGGRPSDVNTIDLFQAFADVMFPLGEDSKFTIRGGRQVIVFGAERLIGVSDFTNVRRTFDGVRGTLTTPGNTVDLFYARPARVQPHTPDDDFPDTSISGVYDTCEIPVWEAARPRLEMYAFYANRQSITFNQTTAGENRYTFGARFTANPKPFDFDIEPDYQVGRFNGQTTHSFSIAAIAGYTLEQVALSPRPFLGFDIASGGHHDNPGNTFDQLFPSGHDKFGIIDAIGRQNIIAVHPGFTLNLLENKPGAERLTLLTQYRQFWRESTQDAVYTSSGSILRPSGGTDAKAIGGELDFQLNWQLDRHITSYAGYCHFFHGAFIAATGPHSDIDFAYTALTFTF